MMAERADPSIWHTLRARLPARFSDLPVFVFSETDSTNDRAKAYAAEHPETRAAVFIAERQTAGRGRRGRSFSSPDGAGLYLSVLFSPPEEGDLLLTETARAAVSVARAIEDAAPDLHPEIKWVNDLLIDGKKTAGILAEAVLSPDGKKPRLILGIGINVHRRAFPPELENIATSLEDHTARTLCRADLAAKLICRILEEEPRPPFIEDYRARLCLTGKVVFILRAAPRRALVLGVNDCGFLHIRYDDGSEELLNSGEISVRFWKE